MIRILLLLIALVAAPLQALEVAAPIHHDLNVTIQPDKRTLAVIDRITLPEPADSLTLELHANLKPKFSKLIRRLVSSPWFIRQHRVLEPCSRPLMW